MKTICHEPRLGTNEACLAARLSRPIGLGRLVKTTALPWLTQGEEASCSMDMTDSYCCAKMLIAQLAPLRVQIGRSGGGRSLRRCMCKLLNSTKTIIAPTN